MRQVTLAARLSAMFIARVLVRLNDNIAPRIRPHYRL